MSKPIIQLNDISASYGKRLALEKVNLTVFDDDYLGVIGPNGGGKTTLMKIILGLKKATKGTIQYFRDGKPVEELTMGYLPQYNKIDHRFPISVYEVVLSGLNRQKRLFRPYTKQQHQQVEATMQRLQLENLRNRPIGEWRTAPTRSFGTIHCLQTRCNHFGRAQYLYRQTVSRTDVRNPQRDTSRLCHHHCQP